jgi:Lar family restriction alleviation protein
MDKLKPCPFCGAEATVFRDGAYSAEKGKNTKKTLWFVGCNECSAIICEGSRTVAIEVWNRRVND